MQAKDESEDQLAEAEEPATEVQPQPQLRSAPARRFGRRQFIGIGAGALASTAAASGFFAAGWLAHKAFRVEDRSPADRLAEALYPPKGVTLDARLGDIPQRLGREGVIDVDKFKLAAGSAGLAAAELDIFSNGSPARLRIHADNASLMLNLLWALGLANKSRVLTDGPIGQAGKEKAGNFASTGGWTLGAKPGPTYLAALELIPLTSGQEDVVREVATATYRPCCGNATAFPDCNHGMAALGLTELMASQGASSDDVFEALKLVSPFWYPTQYHHLALYFQHRGQEWDEVDSRVLMGKEYSSLDGWNKVNTWLQERGLLGSGAGGKSSSCTA